MWRKLEPETEIKTIIIMQAASFVLQSPASVFCEYTVGDHKVTLVIANLLLLAVVMLINVFQPDLGLTTCLSCASLSKYI